MATSKTAKASSGKAKQAQPKHYCHCGEETRRAAIGGAYAGKKWTRMRWGWVCGKEHVSWSLKT